MYLEMQKYNFFLIFLYFHVLKFNFFCYYINFQADNQEKQAIKTVWNILKKVLLTAFLVVYVLIALLNYSVVQSYLGTSASRYFTNAWGGKVHISSLHINPMGHVIIKGLELVSPDNDTIINSDRIGIRFSHFPYSDNTLDLNYVSLRNTYYQLAIIRDDDTSTHINLQYIINYFQSPDTTEDTTHHEPFTIKVKQLHLNNVHYKQDLAPHHIKPAPEHGVDIPHMEYSDIHAKFKDVTVQGSYIDCRIVTFQANEKSGVLLKDLSADISVSPYHIIAHNMELQTAVSRLLLDAELHYPGPWKMDPFCDSVYISANIKPGSIGCMADAAYWAPALWGVDQTFLIEGLFEGPVADMSVSNFIATFGQESALYMDGSIKGLPNIAATDFNIDIHKLHTTYQDLANVHHPQGITMKVPELISSMDIIDMMLQLHGTYSNCVADVDVSSNLGNISVDASIKENPVNKKFRMTANVVSPRLDISSILPNDWVSHSGIDITFNGEGRSFKDLNGNLYAQLTNTNLQGHYLAPATLDCELDNKDLAFSFNINDTLAKIDLAGNINLADSIRSISADLALRQCNLSKLNIIQDTSDFIINSQILLDATGTDIQHAVGSLSLDQTDILVKGHDIPLGSIRLDVHEQNLRKDIHLLSDWCRINCQGYFDYPDLPLIVQQFCNRYIPQYFNHTEPLTPDQTEVIADDQFSFDLLWNDRQGLLHNIAPNISIADGTVIQGNYNFTESVKLVLRSDSVQVGPIGLYDIGFNSSAAPNYYQLKLDIEQYNIAGLNLMQNTKLSSNLSNDETYLALKWGNGSDDPDRGDIAFSLLSDSLSNHLMVIKPIFFINNQRWDINCPNGIEFANKAITADQFTILSNDRSINLNAHISGKDYDYVDANIHKINIKQLIRTITGEDRIDLNGDLNGSCSLYNVTNDPHLNANLNIDRCSFNGFLLGDLEARANWLSESQMMDLELISQVETDTGYFTPIAANGTIALNETNSLNLNLDLDQLQLNTLEPLLTSFASGLSGLLSGNIQIHGTTKDPQFDGLIILDSSQLTINATGVSYFISDSIKANNNTLTFQNFNIRDKLNNTLQLNGNLSLTDLSKPTLDLNIHTPQLLVLDNSSNTTSSYFGTLIASADGNIDGSLSNLNINLNVQTKPGCEITVPIDNKRQVQNLDYITFIGDYTSSGNAPVRAPRSAKSPLNLVVNADITPDVKLHLPMNFNQMLINVGATGAGNILLALNQGQAPSIKGDYEIISGNLVFTLLSLVKKTFTIEEGSLLQFPGNIGDARFDLKAIYPHRTNLSSLTGNLGTENSQKNILVESIIALSGSIQDPQINFDLRLPNADQSVSEEVFAYIDRNNERDMLNQTMSLLILGQFYNASASGDFADNTTANGYAMVANTIGSAVTSMVKFVNVNFDYKAATDLTTEQFDVDISKEWNKFYFESTFGYGGEAHDISQIEGNHNMVGDMLVGYKVSPRVHLFAFNRTNTNDYTRSDLPYKQGFGLKFTRDFNQWSELFKHKTNK